jgi:Low molecular weight phosphotyrosine protein phosphatase/Major intrinsic protein
MNTAVARRLAAEFTGTGLLVAVVVGSGIAATRLTPDGALRLLVNSVVTALGLAVLIVVFIQAGGAHFNPVVTAADWLLGRRTPHRYGTVLAVILYPARPGPRRTAHPARWLIPNGTSMADIPEVLFVCTHNAGRSQMAAALLDHQAAGRIRVTSAGSQPADQLNPAVVEAMAEIGLDISSEFPKPLTTDKVRAADIVVTMGCGDACPV